MKRRWRAGPRWRGLQPKEIRPENGPCHVRLEYRPTQTDLGAVDLDGLGQADRRVTTKVSIILEVNSTSLTLWLSTFIGSSMSLGMFIYENH